jgi:hypothetical protein
MCVWDSRYCVKQWRKLNASNRHMKELLKHTGDNTEQMKHSRKWKAGTIRVMKNTDVDLQTFLKMKHSNCE